MRPIFCFGLGTIGSEIVSHIEKIILKEGDDKTKRWSTCIAIDSAAQPSNKTTAKNFWTLTVDNPSTEEVLNGMVVGADNPAIGESTRQWYPLQANGQPEPYPFASFMDGCGGMRRAGRLLFHRAALGAQLKGIYTKVETRVQDEIRQGRLQPNEIDFQNPICYLFGNLAGGTCSGLFIDFAFLLRACYPPTVKVTGCFLLGDVCHANIPAQQQDRALVGQQDQNTLASLVELSLVQSEAGLRCVQAHWPRRFGLEDVSGAPGLSSNSLQPPFDTVNFVGGKRQSGLPLSKFDEYGRMVAVFYARQFVSAAVADRAGNYVDMVAQARTQINPDYPYRFNNAGRIGYVEIGLPVEKILASLGGKIAAGVKDNHLKNTDAGRVSAALNGLRNTLEWHNFQSVFKPPLCPVPEATKQNHDDGLPEKSEEFSTDWQNAFSVVKNHYLNWMESTTVNGSRARANGFMKETWTKARHDLLSDLLGAGNSSIAIGALKDTLVSFASELRQKYADCSQNLQNVNQQLAEGSPTGMDTAVEKEIKAQVEDYPGKFLGMFVVKGWAGTDAVFERLRVYRDAREAKACLETTLSVLGKLRAEVDYLLVARRLIGKRVAYPILDRKITEASRVFDRTAEPSSSVEQEAISDESSVERFWKSRLLKADELPQRQNRAGIALTRALTGDGTSPLKAFHELLDALSRHGDAYRSDQDEAFRNPDLKTLILGMNRAFEQHFEREEQELRDRILAMSVWDAIADAILLGDEPSPEKALTARFLRYENLSALTPQHSGGVEEFVAKKGYRPRLVFFCDVQAASNVFKKQLRLPDNVDLQTLVNQIFVNHNPQLENVPGMGNIVILKEVVRENPEKYTSYRQLEQVFQGTPISDSLARHLADKRVPEWVKTLVDAKKQWVAKQTGK